MPAENVASFPQRRAAKRKPALGSHGRPLTPRDKQTAEVGLVSFFLTEPREIKPGAFLVHTPWPREQLRDGLKAALPWLHELEALLNDN